MSSYIHFTEEQKQRAAAVDLEEFLRCRGEKLLSSGREKRLASDHSVTVRGNEWYDHAEERGGHAVSFVQRFYGLSYPDAVTMLLGGELGTAYPSAGERTEEPVKPFALPPANKDMRRVFAYLIKHRGIARDVVAHFAKAGLLYEDAEYHNAVFVGTDAEGVPHHAHKRSANSYGKAFRLNVEGSDPRYSFHYVGTDRSLYVFEAPIDMLSFITLYPENWQRHSYVACCGTSIQPVLQMLEQVPQLDTVLLCLGLDELRESEGLDRADMALAENQQQLLDAVAAVNPNVVVLLSAGAPVETPWVGRCKALVYGALSGQAGAGAAADILTGKLCPCGKLSQTWAKAHDDTPAKANFGGEGRNVEYREGLYVGYRYYQTAGVKPAFPFGYGLGYTTFEYSGLKADETGVTLTVTNTGSAAGAEIVQLYVAKPDAKVFRPEQELKGFAKVSLAPGESKTVAIALDDKAFRYWNVKTNAWEVEGGSYQLRVGASSVDIRLTADITVKGTNAPDPYAGLSLTHYVSGQITYVTDAEFEALLGHPIPEDVVRIDRNMTLGEMDHGRSPLGWLAQKVLRSRLDASFAKGKPDLNTVFQYNMPLRALAKMTNGMVSMGMVDGLVWELKGFWLVGIVRVIYEFIKNAILNAQLKKRLRQG